MSPTALSLKHLRESGYTAEVVERWIPFAKIRKDFLGIIDILAIKQSEPGVLGVQTTTKDHAANRMAKARASETLQIWLQCGNQVRSVGLFQERAAR